MFTLTRILSPAANADPSELRKPDIELTPPQFAAAHWVAEFLGSRAAAMATPPSAVGETSEQSEGRYVEEMAPV